MSWLQTLILAILDGVTEIFPISGDVHTQIFMKLLGVTLTNGQLTCLRGYMHLGVFLALVLFFRRELGAMLQEQLVLLGLVRPTGRRRGVPMERRQLMLYFFAALPMLAGLALYPLRRKIEQGRYALAISGLLLGLFGILLYLAVRGASERRREEEITLSDALSVGAAQILSVLPGFSRSGVTAASGLSRGLNTAGAVRMSGLMGVPVFLASGILELITAGKGQSLNAAVCILTLSVTALTALAALRLLRGLSRRGSLSVFAYWCWGAGIFSIALFLISA